MFSGDPQSHNFLCAILARHLIARIAKKLLTPPTRMNPEGDRIRCVAMVLLNFCSKSKQKLKCNLCHGASKRALFHHVGRNSFYCGGCAFVRFERFHALEDFSVERAWNLHCFMGMLQPLPRHKNNQQSFHQLRLMKIL